MKTSLVQDVPVNGTAQVANKRFGVFIVEDHPITQAGLAALINRESDLFVCGSADSAPTALTQITKLKPSIVISDFTLKASNGIELMKNVVALCPDVPILVMSMHDESLFAERAMRAGARGYIMKREAADKILPAIRTILGGDIYLSEQMQRKLLNGVFHSRKAEPGTFPLETLSDRELEVFQLIGNGFTTREIAQRLNLSPKTIDSYREHLKLKLSLENGTELLRRAICWTRFENIVEG
jgi:DNA-binding NarL/FixJ family response regulator